jgi:hypothetical protein
VISLGVEIFVAIPFDYIIVVHLLEALLPFLSVARVVFRVFLRFYKSIFHVSL